jgi:hypothetical protein
MRDHAPNLVLTGKRAISLIRNKGEEKAKEREEKEKKDEIARHSSPHGSVREHSREPSILHNHDGNAAREEKREPG